LDEIHTKLLQISDCGLRIANFGSTEAHAGGTDGAAPRAPARARRKPAAWELKTPWLFARPCGSRRGTADRPHTARVLSAL
jgi:hypothetical protein